MKKNTWINIFFLSFFILLWFLISYSNLVNHLLLPSPLEVIPAFYNLFSKDSILFDLAFSLYRIFVGLFLGVSLGLTLGLILGLTKLSSGLEFIIDFFRSIPAPALIPLFLLLFGIGDFTKIIMTIFLISLWMAVHTTYGIKNANHTRQLSAKAMGLNKIETFLHTTIPEALPHISAGIRTSISLSLILIILSEIIIGADYGLGQRIINFQLFYETANMYAVIIITGLIGYTMNKSYLVLEKKIIHWHEG